MSPAEQLRRLLALGASRAMRYERPLSRVYEAIIANGSREAAERLRALTRGPSGAWPVPDMDELINQARMNTRLLDEPEKVRANALRVVVEEALAEHGIRFDLKNPLIGRVLEGMGQRITHVSESERATIMREVQAGHDKGLSVDDTAARISERSLSAGRTRARVIARTELGAAVNGGGYAAAKLTGVATYKQWLCMPPWTRVQAAGVTAVARRRYDGDLVTIHAGSSGRLRRATPANRRFTVTADHPVLTRRGWIPAKLVEKGDQVLRYEIADGHGSSPPDVYDVPATIAETFDALADPGAAVRVMRRAVDLDGDIADSEVDVVFVAGNLLPNLEALRAQQIADDLLTLSDVRLEAALRSRSIDERLVWKRPAETLRAALLLGALDNARIEVPHLPSGALVTQDNAGFGEYARDSRSGSSVVLAEPQDGPAAEVALDDVVDVQVSAFRGHVYDVTTLSGWCLADGYVVHNSTNDSRTREDHADADGQVVSLSDAFNVGGALLQHPHDPDAPPGDTINCRCVALYLDSPTPLGGYQ